MMDTQPANTSGLEVLYEVFKILMRRVVMINQFIDETIEGGILSLWNQGRLLKKRSN